MNFEHRSYPGWKFQSYTDFIAWVYEDAERELEIHCNGAQTMREMAHFAKRDVAKWEVWLVDKWLPVPPHIERIEDAMAWAIAVWRMR